jgi:putative hydrolase of the HAD superfamily
VVIRAVIFDLDDTLYPEVEFVYSGYRAVAEAVRLRLSIEIYEDLVALWVGGQRGDLFTPVLRKHLGSVEEIYVKQLVKIYRQHTPTLRTFPEVEALLQKLKLSYSLGIISDGFIAVQERKLQALGIGQYFDAVIFTDQWGKEAWKPSTRSFQHILERLQVTGPESVYVGDNPAKDFYGARRVGMPTIRVRHSDGLYKHLEPSSEDHAPDVAIATLDDLEISITRLSQAVSVATESSPC